MTPIFLAIDTSCDDTCAAIVDDHIILSNVVSSQISLHQPYGGVFPTVAKLAHQQNIQPIVTAALKRAKLVPKQLTGVSVTVGPGLAPALEIGIRFATDFAHQHHLPLYPINHLEGHLLSPLLVRNSRPTPPPLTSFPYPPALGLIISGGHSQFVRINSFGDYQTLGQTLDDAIGECLDKIGRLLGLGYPAAPVIEQLALEGNPLRFPFPLPLTTRHDYDLSFSGLKTYARNLITALQTNHPLDKQTLCDLAASTQAGVFRHLLYKLDKLLTNSTITYHHLLVGGGVAANLYLRLQLRRLAHRHHLTVHFPYSKRLCGDNAAMIGLVATLQYSAHLSPVSTLDRQPNLSLTSWPVPAVSPAPTTS